MNFGIEFEAEGILTLEGYTPERPAPSCSDHDSPFFSDPGEPADFEWCGAKIIVGNREIELTEEQAEAIYEALEMDVDDAVKDMTYNSI